MFGIFLKKVSERTNIWNTFKTKLHFILQNQMQIKDISWYFPFAPIELVCKYYLEEIKTSFLITKLYNYYENCLSSESRT